MLTILFLISILLNAVLGTLPVIGPIIAGFVTALLIREKNSAMVVSFLAAIIGGVLCRVFLLYSNNGWHHWLLNLFGYSLGRYTALVIEGNIFFFALYFGLLGLSGGLVGAYFFNMMFKNKRL